LEKFFYLEDFYIICLGKIENFFVPFSDSKQNQQRMSSFTSESTHSVSSSTKELQLSKGQDYATSGHFKDEGEEFDWIALFDGHGGDPTIEKIRSLGLGFIVATSDPPRTLQDLLLNEKTVPLDYSGVTRMSGSTMCLAKIYKDRIVCFAVGDSELYVYEDGVKVFAHEYHNWDNLAERERLLNKDPCVYSSPNRSFEVVSPTLLQQTTPDYVYYPGGNSLALTQAIGHNDMTGLRPNVVEIPIQPGKTYRVFMASDGVFDVLMQSEKETFGASRSCDEVISFAEERWRQSWDQVDPNDSTKGLGNPFKFTLPAHFDDLSVAIADIVPI
jgi:serine/threonine protein phosphatase PrpC